MDQMEIFNWEQNINSDLSVKDNAGIELGYCGGQDDEFGYSEKKLNQWVQSNNPLN